MKLYLNIRNNKKKSGGAIYSELADFTEKFLQGTEHLLVAMSPGAIKLQQLNNCIMVLEKN